MVLFIILVTHTNGFKSDVYADFHLVLGLFINCILMAINVIHMLNRGAGSVISYKLY